MNVSSTTSISAGGVVEVVPLNSKTDLDPSFDALIVDYIAMTNPSSLPGTGTLTQRIRNLFDLARSFGVLGIFNSESNVGGDRSAVTVAEKADALTGTRALLTLGILARNPNSVTRVASSSLMTDNGTELRAALASVGVGTVFKDATRIETVRSRERLVLASNATGQLTLGHVLLKSIHSACESVRQTESH